MQVEATLVKSRWCVAVLAALLVASCGSGGPVGGSSQGTFENNGGTAGPGGTGGIGGGGGNNAGPLKGGVLVTFGVFNAQFRGWIMDPAAAQQLVDAFAGNGPAITAICTEVVPGSGQANHNAPWSWSLRNVAPNFSGFCLGCANNWNTPAAAEAGILAGPPYNCPVNIGAPVPGPGGGGPAPRAMIFMQVNLVDVQDLR